MSHGYEMHSGLRSKRSGGGITVTVPFPQRLTTTAVPALAACLSLTTAHAISFVLHCTQ